MIELPKSGDVTPPLYEFLALYSANDNVWWQIECGHHQNLFEAAVERIAALESAAEAMAVALGEIEAMQPEPFEFPADWEAQIRACSECARYKSHPIQQGICDEHRRPLWARERHDSDEEKRMGYRCKLKARAALASWRALAAGKEGERG